MKTMTCKQLGGACNLTFTASTFEEIAELSKQHGMQMFQNNDAPHLEAMQKIQNLMKDPKAMQTWFESKRKEFESLPEDA
jgi:predicted small metal-binding protein